MKKLFILSLFLFFVFTFESNIQAQQVEKNYVVVEIGTGTWCQYCPGAALGADDLVDNGHQVAIIENHNGDSFSNAYSNSRNSYYGITGYPTAVFNGQNPVVGGDHTQSMYPSYIGPYNAAISAMSDFSLDMSFTNNGLDYDVTINLDEPGNYAGTNLKVHLFLTESHIQYNWQGQSELNFVNRAMYPNQNGTSYTGDADTINLSFTADASWDLSQCELVAFVQDVSTKEILQADKVTLASPEGTNNIDVQEAEVFNSCHAIHPEFKVRNAGADDITSLEVSYSINAGAETGTTTWNGTIPFNVIRHIMLDEIVPEEILTNNTIDFEVTQVNGVADDDPANNSISATFDYAFELPDNYLRIYIRTDNNGNDITWTLNDGEGYAIESGGPYANNQTINVYPTLLHGCYTFNLTDAGGDGGNVVALIDSTSAPFYYTSGDFGGGIIQDFFSYDPDSMGVEDLAFQEVNIFPNPAQQNLQVLNAEGLDMAIFDVMGRKVFEKQTLSAQEQIQVSKMAEGTYFVHLTDGQDVRVEKIVIRR